MFQELMPLLVQRTLFLTVSRVDSDTICLNIIPQRGPNETGENAALTTPLSLTATPQELDEQLSQQLVEYVGAHLKLSSTLRSAKAEMDAAAKLAKEAARKPEASGAKTSLSRSKQVGPTPGEEQSSASLEDDEDSGKEDPAEASTAESPKSGNLFGA